MNWLIAGSLFWCTGIAVTYVGTRLHGWEPVDGSAAGAWRLVVLLAGWPLIFLLLLEDEYHEEDDD